MMNALIARLKSKPLLRFSAVLLAGLLLGLWLQDHDHGPDAEPDTAHAAAPGEPPGDSIHVCPMMCVPPRNAPGDCPVCGMQLIAVPAGDPSALPRVKLAPETVRLARIRTAPVERRHVSAEVRLFGQIEYDPVHISYQTAYVPGVIDRIYVKRAGQMVRWGDPLFDIRSPEILMVQEQLVEALKLVPGFFSLDQSKAHVRKRSEVLLDRPGHLSKPGPEQKKALDTINAMRLKLTLIGMEKVDIDELMKKGEPTGIATIYAQRSGIVIQQNAFVGTYVNTGTPVFALATPKFVWARLSAYEADYPWIRIGQTAEFVTETFPGETFSGKVVAIDPVFDTRSRTFSVGVVVPESGGRFRPSMFVRAVIQAQLNARGQVIADAEAAGTAPLVIPDSAPLITGKRAVVYVALPGEEGLYEGREIVLGPKSREHYIVLEGLQEGEQVVVNGNFKLDSQVQILARNSMMSIEGGAPADAHQHHGGSARVESDFRRQPARTLPEDIDQHRETLPAVPASMETEAREMPPGYGAPIELPAPMPGGGHQHP